MKALCASIIAAVFTVTYFVAQDRERARNAVAEQFEKTRRDEEERVKNLDECADKAKSDYVQQTVYASQSDQCSDPDKRKCQPPVPRSETLEWQKRALDEALAQKKMAIDVRLAAARK